MFAPLQYDRAVSQVCGQGDARDVSDMAVGRQCRVPLRFCQRGES
jgi:hypothetical protein